MRVIVSKLIIKKRLDANRYKMISNLYDFQR